MNTPTSFDLAAVFPTLLLVVWGLALLLIGLIPSQRVKSLLVPWLAFLGLIGALVATVARWNQPIRGFNDAVLLDNFGLFLHLVFTGAGAVTVALSIHYLQDRGLHRTEYYPLLLFSISGMTLMSSVNDFAMLFIALELLSIPLYVLAGFARPASESEESALKYFLLGAFASAFLIYGVALIYGGTGTTAFPEIIEGAMGGNLALTLAGAGLILVGLSFKIGAAPFHMWTPDVYEGAPTPVTGFMSVGAKTAGLAAIGRVFLLTLPSLSNDWMPAIAILAALTMILGNVIALSQTNIKRMLAYSSIAHAGYLLMGVAARSDRGTAGLLFYLLAYGFTNLGAFAVLTAMAGPEGEDLSFAPYAGLAKRHPWMAAAMALFMFSLTGIPPTGGFVGKYYLFWAAVESDLVWLAVVGVLTSLISAFFYLRVVVTMYFGDPVQEQSLPLYPALATAIFVTAAGTLGLGLWPEPVLQLAQHSAWSIPAWILAF
jgi:NADH-quinone oxidoreductase subunit N